MCVWLYTQTDFTNTNYHLIHAATYIRTYIQEPGNLILIVHNYCADGSFQGTYHIIIIIFPSVKQKLSIFPRKQLDMFVVFFNPSAGARYSPSLSSTAASENPVVMAVPGNSAGGQRSPTTRKSL